MCTVAKCSLGKSTWLNPPNCCCHHWCWCCCHCCCFHPPIVSGFQLAHIWTQPCTSCPSARFATIANTWSQITISHQGVKISTGFLGTCWLNRWGNWKFKLFLLYLPKTFRILLQVLGRRFNFTDLSRTMCSCHIERVETKNIMLVFFLLICVWCVWNKQSLNCRQAALCRSCNVNHRVGASDRRVDADGQHICVLRIWSYVCRRWSRVSIVDHRPQSRCRQLALCMSASGCT